MTERKRDDKQGAGVGLKDREKLRLQKPPKYKVVMHNDDYTPMAFVTVILMQIFHKNKADALNLTEQVHKQGKGIAGAGYTREIAATKCAHTMDAAKELGHPFLVEMEPE